MGKKKANSDGAGSAGGAAAAAGVGFQKRLAAYAMTHAAVGLNDLSALDLGTDFDIKSIHLETSLEVDDLLLKGKSTRALIQAKRTVDISDSPKSTFSDAIGQFVRHHFTSRQPGDRYILATSMRASGRVVYELRKLTESVRLNAKALVDDPLTKAEKEVVEKTQKLISHHISASRPGPVTESDIHEVFSSIWVLPLDIEVGGRDEATAVNILRSRSKVDPTLIWKMLIDIADSLMTKRGSIDLNGLQSRLGGLFKSAEKEKKVEDEFSFEVVQMNDLACGVEVVVFDQAFESKKVAIIEFGRFNDDGTRPLRFEGNLCFLNDGEGQPYLFRSATMAGLERFFERKLHTIQGCEVIIMPRPEGANPNDTPRALAHRELITKIMQKRDNPLSCMVCGLAVSENKALIAEIDEEGYELDAGFVHWHCHRPSLRVLGEVQSELFAKFNALRNFDYLAWIRAMRYGQGMLFDMPLPPEVLPLAWNSKAYAKFGGKWSVQISTEDGSSFIATERGRVSRYSEEEISEIVENFNDWIESSEREKNPMCISADKQHCAPYSAIIRIIPGEKPIRWIRAAPVPFTKAIEVAYSTRGNYYAPVVLLVTLKDDVPVVFKNENHSDALFLISDPFRLAAHIENWKCAGYAIPEFGLHVITNDQAFDALARRCQDEGTQIFFNPAFDLEGKLVRGIVLRTLEDILEEQS